MTAEQPAPQHEGVAETLADVAHHWDSESGVSLFDAMAAALAPIIAQHQHEQRAAEKALREES
jgi:hypothetical protein